MRDRHWKLLMTITGVEFERGASFCLADLLKLQLHKYVDDVGEVVDRAVKEDKMEQTLAKLKVTWAAVEFEFDQHRDTDVYLMRMKEEDFETLEDNQLVVQGMMASKYLATFEEEVTGWQKKLGNVSEVLAQMSEVQRKWAYLETLFIGSEEVKKELPESTQRFVGIDKTFKGTLGAIHKTKNAVAATNVDGQLKTLESMADELTLCEKDLADFLESKRRIFPRFYFLATNYLLDILSNGNRPWIVAGHINNILQGVKALTLKGSGQDSLEEFVANEGEILDTKLTGPLKLKGKVEYYLGDIINKLREEMLAKVAAAIKDYNTTGLKSAGASRLRSEWLADHLGQLDIVVTQFAWTRDVELAFDAMGSGNANGMREYSEKQVEMMNDLIMLVQDRGLEKNHRRKAMNIITMETHSRDIVLSMIEDGFDKKDCFKWVGQLKTRFEMRPASPGNDGKSEDIWADICDATFQYSFEYLGNPGRLLITPLTDRIYITATQASHLNLGCAPAGPAGTGKTETTKDL